MKRAIANSLKEWFEGEKRELPWRQKVTPYRVWISEVMLQQTQVSVVIPYFNKWMEIFPTIEILASSPIETVIKVWEGLGYYSRARNIHKAANHLIEHHKGVFPQTEEELLKIPGFGPYTVGAVLSFAFRQKAAAVDGNVIRVISRLFRIEGEISQSSTRKRIVGETASILPNIEPWVVMEGMIEFGALVCTKKPNCLNCPLRAHCMAFRDGVQDKLPVKKKRAQTTHLKRHVFILCDGKEVLVRKTPKGDVMADLYEFPWIEESDLEKRANHFLKELDTNPSERLKPVSHSFTRYRAELYPAVWEVKEFPKLKGYRVIPIRKLKTLPFSSGHRQIRIQLENKNTSR